MRRILTITAFLCLTVAYAQKNKTNSENGRQNWFPNKGNVGIGTRNPVTDLEVIGSIKASDNIQSNSLNIVDLFGTNFTFSNNGVIGGNLLISGNVGIGVNETLEKLHVLGNIKASDGLLGSRLEVTTGSFLEHVTIGGNTTVAGSGFILGSLGVGTENPEEKLHILGNTKISETLFANAYQVVSGTVSENLNVQQDARIDGILSSGTLQVDGASTFNDNLSIVGETSFGGNAIFDSNVGIGVTNPVERLSVSGDIRATDAIFASTSNVNDANVSQDLIVDQNALVKQNVQVDGNNVVAGETSTGSLKVNTDSYFLGNGQIDGILSIGAITSAEKLNVGGNVKVEGDVMADGMSLTDLTTNTLQAQEVTIENNTAIGGNLEVDGNISGTDITSQSLNTASTSTNTLAVQTSADIIGPLNVQGNVGVGTSSPTEKLHVVGNTKIDGDLMADGMNVEDFTTNTLEANTASVNQNATVGNNLNVSGNLALGVANAQEKIHVGGNAKVDGSVNSQSLSTGDITVSNNVDISGNLALGVATAAEKLHVGGNAKIDGDLMAEAMNVDNFTSESLETESAVVNQNATVKGDLGVDGNIALGVTTAEEQLHVGGNIKVEGNIVTNDVKSAILTANSVESGSMNLTSNANIGGNVTVMGNITAANLDSDVLTSNSISTGSANFSSNANILGSLDVGGNLGIGVVTAAEKLHVGGNMKLDGDLLANSVNVDGFSSTTIETDEVTVNHDAWVTGNLEVEGNIGIGVVDPQERLHIDGGLKVNNDINSQSITTNAIEATNGTFDKLTTGELVNTSTSGNLVLGTKGLERMTILSNGKVGIGTSSPDNMLTVAGNIHGQRVKVTIEAGTGPDYVFKDDYQLRTLKEVQEFIKMHSHLPEVPSAKKMETEGVELGEMNMLLLKKIEELTLYQLELLERIEKLEKSLSDK